MPRRGTRSSAKVPAKKTAGAPKPKAKPRGQASALAEATAADSAAIQSPGASNAPSSTNSRRSRSPDLPPVDRPNPRFAYRDHSPGSPAEPERVLYSGDESDPHEAEDSHSAPSPAPAAPASREGETRPSRSQADPQAKAARTASDPAPGRDSTSSRKRSASQSPRGKARDSFRGLFDSSSDDEEGEGAVPEPQEISNDLDGQQERYHAAQLQSSNLPSAQASVPVQSTQTAGAELALSSVLDQRELRIKFAHLIAKQQLSVRGSACDERGYVAYTKVTLPRRVAKKPQTTYEAAVASGHRSRQPSGSQPGAGPPAPTSSVKLGIRATSQGADASYERAAPGEHAPHAVALQQEGMRLFRDRLYAIEIALGLGPGGQATALSGKQGALEDLRAEVQSLRHEIRDLHDRVDCRAAVGEVSTLRQEVYHLRSELRALRETQSYGYPSSYGSHAYGAPPMDLQAYIAPAAELRPHAPWSYDQRGYPPAYREPAPASAGHPRVSETPSRFEVVQSLPLDPDAGHLGQTAPADHEPLETTHIKRRVRLHRLRQVDGVGIVMPTQDREGPNEAMLPLVAPHGTYRI
ncbi:unnamed protein product [Phytophthora fragariaefolia]|uniref:Unnamed protein product n=1 Tax=Phytophthora fragariaefolia TaxID=1490495 RepID=A0A9W6U501_9STRA|nr:unnamed protein product [Phytophthora fragariaefolia]